MRVVIVGLGVQGKKRLQVAGGDAVAVVDPVQPSAHFKRIEDVPIKEYDAAILCVPDEVKLDLILYLAENRKHIMVEKPLIAESNQDLQKLKQCVQKNEIVCYTAYNHRFEPHIVRLKELIDSGELGKIYQCNFLYSNGTARDVRNSAWRDKGMGVFPDLGSHVLDWTLMLFGKPQVEPFVWEARRFENKAYDYFHFGFSGDVAIDYRLTLLSWKNSFRCDVYAEKGTAHIDCLCKWGPSTFTHRGRVLPSGRPDEKSWILTNSDPTWVMEYEHFKNMCKHPAHNIDNDIWINEIFLKVKEKLGCEK
jgi:scyllo-inositol 2-dehydrogenase (NADP+)